MQSDYFTKFEVFQRELFFNLFTSKEKEPPAKPNLNKNLGTSKVKKTEKATVTPPTIKIVKKEHTPVQRRSTSSRKSSNDTQSSIEGNNQETFCSFPTPTQRPKKRKRKSSVNSNTTDENSNVYSNGRLNRSEPLQQQQSNIYETPRRSFSIPQNNGDTKGLRRGRSKNLKSSILSPEIPEKEFEDLTQEEFLGYFQLMRMV